MKKYVCLLIGLGMYCTLTAQVLSPTYTAPPNAPNVRSMAEWEEIESLVVTWTGTASGFPYILTQIIQHAKEECEVIVICGHNKTNSVVNYLAAYGVDTANVTFVEDFYNSVWIRDYGASTIYSEYIDSLYLIDWIYNRPRPMDDRIPRVISNHVDVPLYSTTFSPYDLVNTGGNFMTDGQGTAFASKLIIEENGPLGTYNNSIRTEAGIDSIMESFMGIDRFIKVEMAQFNKIHHIDMYMKLLNEETLLVGEYPSGVADGPRIEANIQYIQDNYSSVFGTPYHIVRVPMPPDTCGNYPNYFGPSCQAGVGSYRGHYRTYTNLVFVNKTVLVPTYSWQYDTTAFKILQEQLPGYKLVGIDCDDMISFSGALHCITRAVGVRNPLLMVHQPLRNKIQNTQGFLVNAKLQHNSFIETAQIFYRTQSNQPFTAVPMTNIYDNYWEGTIPNQNVGTTIEYYIKAKSYSGKEQVRPITAPDGFWSFEVELQTSVTQIEPSALSLQSIYPNPAGDKVFIPIEAEQRLQAQIFIYNMTGQLIKTIFQGELSTGNTIVEATVKGLPTGSYMVVVQSEGKRWTQPLIVK